MRLLYGYRSSGGRVSIIEREAVVVRAILAAKPGDRASAVLRAITVPESDCTIRNRITKVIRHRRWYLTGKSAECHRADPSLAIKPEPALEPAC